MAAKTKPTSKVYNRKALCVGINNYQYTTPLKGCTNDALQIAELLAHNGDDSPNFQVSTMVTSGKGVSIGRKALKSEIEALFNSRCDIVLFYFSGHGHLERTGGYLVTSDAIDFDDGLAMYELIGLANSSPAKNKIIILDCCFAGTVGSMISNDAFSFLSDGLSIMAATKPKKLSYEEDGAGIFTTLLIEALKGGGSDLFGAITPTSAFSFVDKALGPWIQRPVFKSNTSDFISIRKVVPPIPVDILKKLTEYFANPDDEFQLDPSFEYTNSPGGLTSLPIKPYAIDKNVRIFYVLQKLQSVGLVVPVDAPFMYFAAMESKSCMLTPLGKHYWRLVKQGKIK